MEGAAVPWGLSNGLLTSVASQLGTKELWQDSKMQEFRKQFWEPMDQDLNSLANDLESRTSLLDFAVSFIKNIIQF
jgi:hypothetical protein